MGRFFATIGNLFKIPELKRRIFITFILLLIFRLGVHIPIPNINLSALSDMLNRANQGGGAAAGVFSMVDLLSGGALKRMSLLSLGIMPYISASIIFQLLIKVLPSLEALSKEGPAGYRKISQYTRIATVPICLFQAIFIIKLLMANKGLVYNPTIGFYMSTILTLTAGTMFLMWLGEQITVHGIGNGASIIIMAGIVARMPAAVGQIVTDLRTGNSITPDKVIILALLYVLVVIAIVITTQAQRRIPVQASKHIRGAKVFGGQRHYLPLKVNQANVMPVIFAAALISLPVSLFSSFKTTAIGGILFDAITGYGFWRIFIYSALVFFFCYFWTALMFQPAEMASQLKERGSFIPGIRPGKNTSEYLERVMNRVTLAGATFLCIIALLPDIASQYLGLSYYVTSFLGGTGILIVVGVGLDLMQKIESHLIMRDYDGFFSSSSKRTRGRR